MEKKTDKEDLDREETNVTSSEYLFIFVFNSKLQELLQCLFYFSQGGDNNNSHHIGGVIETEKGEWNANGAFSQLLLLLLLEPQIFLPMTMEFPCSLKRLWVCLWCM